MSHDCSCNALAASAPTTWRPIRSMLSVMYNLCKAELTSLSDTHADAVQGQTNKPYDAETLLGDKEDRMLRPADLFMANTLPGVDENAPTYVEDPQGETWTLCLPGFLTGCDHDCWA